MGDILKYGLLAVGGWVLYTQFFAEPASAAAPPTSTGGGAPPPAPPAPPTSSAITSDSQATQQSKLLTAAGKTADQLYNASEWNFYFERVYGRNPGALGDDGSPMLIGAYLNLLRGRGLSGLGARFIRMPPVLTVPAANAIRRAVAMRARTTNYLPAGTPMVRRGF